MEIPAAYRSARGLVLPDDGADYKFRIYFLRFRPDYFRMVKFIDDIRHSCTKILRMPGQHNFYENMTESDNQPAINSLCFRGRQIIIKYSVLLPPGGYMVHIDLCTKEGVMKAYAFQTPMQAMTLLDTIKDDEFQWFNLEWDGQRFTCPYHFIKRLSSRSYIRSFWR